MMKLQPDESILTGNWVSQNGQIVSDETDMRIGWLIENCLIKIAVSPQWGAWEILYKDPDDGRYWEATYPNGEMQGGGPRQIRHFSAEKALQKYGIIESG